jgi:hypothetical protein
VKFADSDQLIRGFGENHHQLVLLYLQFLSWFFKGGKMLRDR